MYKLTNRGTILRISDYAFIPIDQKNIDYVSYQAWVNDGNMPEPADVQPEYFPPLSPWQVRQTLNVTGLRADVEDMITAGSQELRDVWFFADVFERNNNVVVLMAPVAGITESQLDDLWRFGATLRPVSV